MSLVVVLVETQDLVNIAGVVRVMKNFGLRDLRLVCPQEYEPRRIEGVAHKTGDVLKRVAIFENFESAVADCILIAGLTARERTAKRNVVRPREAASELVAAADAGTVAVVLGREDRGLTNDQLDRCHRSIIIPTNPDHPSLNLAQAFTVMAYELFLTRGEQPFKVPRRDAPPATGDQLESLFTAARETLEAIEFFKTGNPEPIVRTVREVTHRASLDAREAKLIQAMCMEVLRFLERSGVR
ncbi:MAG: TrmJ/YjtD family RNA methyltransferase [Gemmatimonadales bacterium]|nr:TrmJ/YjtD family RNA methyltransferase [Gemmatimonadales bacterium]